MQPAVQMPCHLLTDRPARRAGDDAAASV